MGNGPYTGSFYDTPLTVGTYWYGIHVGDDAGNWITEGGSGFSPIQVEVIQANNPPQLSSGHVDPSSGTPSTNFYYYVTYFDPDGDSPSVKQVYIDGIAYTMSLYSGSASNGVYRYGPKNLSAGGTHYYFFYFEDGKGGWCRLPYGVDMYLGPSVTPETYPPQVTTEGSSSITTSSAVLTGNLDSTGGETCQVWFEYGTTTSYGSSTSKLSVSSTGPFSAVISTLNPDTTYHFRACAQNSKGTSYGSDMTFKTAKETYPPQVTTEGASSITTSSAVLTGNLDSTGGETCQVWFEYGTTVSYGSSTSKLSVSSTGPFSAFISTLNPDTTYHFRACAQDSKGTSYGSDMTFKTEPADQVVTFTDPNLEAAIRAAIGKPTGDIYQSDLLGLTSLNAFDRDIANIAGLEHCTSLTELDLGSNRISNLEPLSGLNKLEVLSLLNNQIGDLEPLSNLTSLRYLALSSNQISTISPISNLHDLTDLLLTNNLISDIFPLSNLLNLSQLGLGANQISNLQPLSNLTKLGYLYLDNNQINSISPISNLVDLKLLGLARNQISDVSPIWNLTNLQLLDLQNNYISNISSLVGLINLESLWLSDNQVSDINALSMLTEIRILLLDDNQIANITPLSGLTKLGETELYSEREGVKIYLGLQNNQISDILPLVDNKGINEEDGMDLRGNSLSADSLSTYIPQLQARGVNVLYDVPRTWYVDDDRVDYPAADFTKIQDAVNAASAGDTIIVYPGTYTENVDVTKAVTIQSEHGAATTIVEPSDPFDHVFHVTADWVNIRGLTVRNANGLIWLPSGICLSNVRHCTVSGNNLVNNLAGIHLENSSANTLSGNILSLNWYWGVALSNSDGNTISGNVFSNNTYFGIGLGGTQNVVTGNDFTNDGLFVEGRQNTVQDNTVNGKRLVYLEGVSGTTVTGVDIGQVILVDCDHMTVDGLTLDRTTVGIQLWGTNRSRILNNSMTWATYAIHLDHANENLVRNNVPDGYFGIYLAVSNSNVVTENDVLDSAYAIQSWLSADNIIYLNNFRSAYGDASEGNRFNSPEQMSYVYGGTSHTGYLGNYWSHYIGGDTNNDGIGDTPHPIGADQDNYPLIEPFENYVIGPENQPPVGSFTCSPENPFSGDVVYFDASSSYDPDGTIVSHEWDFGDGDTATGQQVTHRFRGAMGEAKEYTVELMIEDDKGATDSNTHTITVYPLMRYTTVYSSLCQFLPPPVPPIMEVVVYYNWVDVKDGKDEYIVSEVHLYSEEGLNFALYMFSIEDDGEKVWSKIHKGVGKEDISFTYPFGVPRDCVKSIGDEHFEGLVVGSNSKLNFLVYGVELGLQLKPSFFRVSRTVEFGPGKQTELLPICPEGTPGIVATVASPVELRVYDLDGNITGLVDGEIREGIPDSTYDGQSGTCVIFSPEDIASCYYEIVGVDIGTYGLEIIAVKDGEANTFAATDIPTAPGAVHQYTIDWDVLSQGGEGVTVQIDSDGDGEFEDTFTSDGELTQDEFLHETIPQLLKQDAISNLEVIKPTKKTAQRLIDNSIQSINKSLSNRLWADDSHLNSRMMVGTLVFDMEKAAVLNLKATERVEPTIENEIEAVIDKLTEADKLLCIIAINDAKSIEVKDPWAKRIVDWQITKAEEELDKAYEYLDKDMPDKAITHFKLAWIHAEATGAASPASHRRG